MEYQGEVLPVNLTPRTGVTFGMPDKVLGTILKRPPREPATVEEARPPFRHF